MIDIFSAQKSQKKINKKRLIFTQIAANTKNNYTENQTEKGSNTCKNSSKKNNKQKTVFANTKHYRFFHKTSVNW